MNTFYTKGKQALLDGSVIWTTSNIKAMLIDTALYSVNASADTYLSDIPVAARIAPSPLLASRTASDGVADAADPTIPSVTGASVEAYVIYNDTGSAATSRLLLYIDTATGLPFTPNGGDIVLQFNASGLFSL